MSPVLARSRSAAIVVGAAATPLLLGWYAQRRHADTRADNFLAYLTSHLAGADSALQVVAGLKRTSSEPELSALFAWLEEQLRSDRRIVEAVLRSHGGGSPSLKRALGSAGGAVIRVVTGTRHTTLRRFEAVEALAIGIQGKRCLWRTLATMGPRLHIKDVDFAELEASALRQWEAVDNCRLRMASSTFRQWRD